MIMIIGICNAMGLGMVFAEDVKRSLPSSGDFNEFKTWVLSRIVLFARNANLFFGLIVDINQFFVFQTLLICYKRRVH